MISITWIGPDRDVPAYGGFTLGDRRKVSQKDADSLVRQGLAEYTNAKKSKEEEKPSTSRRATRAKEE